MTNAISPVPSSVLNAQAYEQALIGGDLSKLSGPERLSLYRAVCDSLGLNALTAPFSYITLNGKLTLYARKDATDQLRKIHGISIAKPDITFQEDWIIVSVLATAKDGRTDADTGVVNKKDMRGDFGNAVMKAITKAKRRVTLSICGLGILDETEIESVPFAQPVAVDTETGEIQPAAPRLTLAAPTASDREPGDEPPDDIAYAMGEDEEPAPAPRRGLSQATISQPQQKRLFAIAMKAGWDKEGLRAYLTGLGFAHSKDIHTGQEYEDICAALEAGPQVTR